MNTHVDMDHRTLLLARTLPVPRERVFAAWTSATGPLRWWGMPKGALPEQERTFRVGDTYRCPMPPAKGVERWARGRFVHLEAPTRLVFTWLREDDGDIWCDTVVLITFGTLGNCTLLTLEQTTFATPAHCAEHAKGWATCLDRLAEELDTVIHGTTYITP